MASSEVGACLGGGEPRQAAIRALNDRFRQSFVGGEVVVTQGVLALPTLTLHALLARVQAFAEFGPDNDPYQEHDFGAIDHAGERYFWKIDYHDTRLAGASPDPADPDLTRRVLTIMHSEEY